MTSADLRPLAIATIIVLLLVIASGLAAAATIP
jgi:hypothetical protein